MAEEAAEVEMTGNLVTDESLSEVQRNQQNTVEKRLERVEAELFPEKEAKKPSVGPTTKK